MIEKQQIIDTIKEKIQYYQFLLSLLNIDYSSLNNEQFKNLLDVIAQVYGDARDEYYLRKDVQGEWFNDQSPQ